MVIATHPDDETLGCGGTLLKHRSKGDATYWIIATAMSKDVGFKPQEIRQREREIELVARRYQFSDIISLGHVATMLDQVPMRTVIESIAAAIQKVKPQIIYLPFGGDVHGDHRLVFEAVCSSTKVFRFPSIRRLCMMETLSETEYAPAYGARSFAPNHFVDISDFMRDKCEILKIYKSEIGLPPFPRSIATVRALAAYRGANAGCRFAEAFMFLRDLW
jgi:LmbE family N-acetylglucosaminyl deacetylase